ncbi:thymidylate kinase [Arthrobacter sp. MYb213]|uniref:dTMP kinase n=1 Tax=Arthrobacter sp. MYb213 TaxID=1848595 RepID=UPI0015E2D328|nr:thymidylate kinase [Arthrobacter sp. MYb213]
MLGIDGSGKSTAIAALVHILQQQDLPTQRVANPAARKWLNQRVDNSRFEISRATQDGIESIFRLFNVTRNTIKASLFSGVTVMDRHLACQLALRQVRGLPQGRFFLWLALAYTQDADVVVLDVGADTAYSRIHQRGEDTETKEFLEASRNAYLEMAAKHKWTVISSAQSVDGVVDELLAVLEK